jgi:hypothetical protein
VSPRIAARIEHDQLFNSPINNLLTSRHVHRLHDRYRRSWRARRPRRRRGGISLAAYFHAAVFPPALPHALDSHRHHQLMAIVRDGVIG